ncbi:MAG: N-acetylmuramoyl-L-alanine amidase [Oscillospiraceae bacterium]|nr:N-acetylmuramoyl-L-alanine amidase [Oscillospiraceae bacterium]
MSKKVCIEIGHIKPDPGAVSGNIRECDINLAVGLELKRQLERHDVETLVNRTEWEGITLADYFKKAAAMKPDAGISVHSNTAAGTSGAGTAKGFEAYRQTNSYNTVSANLCQLIETEVKALGQPSRGIKVHTNQNINNYINSVTAPYAYCELGFIDNPADYARFNTETKQKNFGTAYAKGILKYLGVTWKNETASGDSSGTANIMYRVQTGVFGDKKNAEKLQAELKTKGYETFVIVSDSETPTSNSPAALKVGDRVRVTAAYAANTFAKAPSTSSAVGGVRYITRVFTDSTALFPYQIGVKAGDVSSINTTGFAKASGLVKV